MSKKPSIFKFILIVFEEIRNQKKWYLLPIWILLAAIGLIILASGTSYLIPAIYIAI